MNIISMSQPAKEHLLQWIKKEQAMGIYLTMKQQGCSGWQYELVTVNEAPAGSVKQVFPEFTCFIQSKLINKIQGTEVDLEHLSLGQKKINFKNPKATAVCGCGESFQWGDQNA